MDEDSRPPRKRTNRDKANNNGQDSKEAKKRKTQLNTLVHEFLTKARTNVEYWASEACKELRHFCAYVASHSFKFPMPLSDSPVVDSQDRDPSVRSSPPKLSNGFIKKLANGMYKNDGSSEDPIVRVIGCNIDFQVSGYKQGQRQKIPRVKLDLWDGSDLMCLGMPASHLLYAAKTQLTKGQPIIRLKLFTETSYNDNGIIRPGVAIVQYQFLCRPAKDVDAKKLKSHGKLFFACCNDNGDDSDNGGTDSSFDAVAEAQSLQNPRTQFHQRILEFQKTSVEMEVQRLPKDCMRLCSEQCRLCSCHGHRFPYCLAEKYEKQVASSEFLEAIAEHCYFVDREVSAMDPSLQRNLLYYWFATNIYFVKGAGNRKVLPDCLVCLIRMSYPNKKGVPYKKFREHN